MKSVSKDARAEIERAVEDLCDKAVSVRACEALLVAAMQGPFARLQEAVVSYNEAAEGLNDRLDDVIGDVQAFIDARSERWREGEVAQRYSDWITGLESAKNETIDEPEMPEFDLDNLADEMRAPPLALADL